jgi:hypothetical protein
MINGESYYNPAATKLRGPLGILEGNTEIIGNAVLLIFFIIIYAFTKSFIALFFLLWCIVGLGYSIYQKINVGESKLERPCIDSDGNTLT